MISESKEQLIIRIDSLREQLTETEEDLDRAMAALQEAAVDNEMLRNRILQTLPDFDAESTMEQPPAPSEST